MPSVFLDRVHVHDVRVDQPGDGLRLPLETLQAGGVVGELGGEDLQGDIAIQLGVPGAVDLAHAAPAEEADDLVVAEGFADQVPPPGKRIGIL